MHPPQLSLPGSTFHRSLRAKPRRLEALWPPSMGEGRSIAMKEILIAVIITALTIEAVESLDCVQCDWTTSCVNVNHSLCPQEAQASCISSLVTSTLGGANSSYTDKSCFGDVCSDKDQVIANFTVHVSNKEHFQFASQCCNGTGCNDKDAAAPALEDIPRTMVCPACYGSDEASCSVKYQNCSAEERCVNLLADFKNGSMSKTLVLKGCSNISNSTCQYLSAGNKTVGRVVFRKFECSGSINTSSTPAPPTKPTVLTSSSSKFSLTPLALVSLLLLGLLF